MNDFFYLFVAELFAIAAIWHNKSPRSEREHESGRPDPAVLFSRIRPKKLPMAPRCRNMSPRATNLPGEFHSLPLVDMKTPLEAETVMTEL